MAARVNDAYSVLLRRNKLPMSLIQEPSTRATTAGIGSNKLTAVESFPDTFGPGSRRKRPRLDPAMAASFEEYAVTGENAVHESEAATLAAAAKAAGAGMVPEDAEIGAAVSQAKLQKRAMCSSLPFSGLELCYSRDSRAI